MLPIPWNYSKIGLLYFVSLLNKDLFYSTLIHNKNLLNGVPLFVVFSGEMKGESSDQNMAAKSQWIIHWDHKLTHLLQISWKVIVMILSSKANYTTKILLDLESRLLAVSLK